MVVVIPRARRPFSTNEAIRVSSSAIRMLFIGSVCSGGRIKALARVPRDDDRERGAGALLADQRDAPPMCLGDGTHDRQPEPGPGSRSSFLSAGSVEPREDGRLFGLRDTATAIADPQAGVDVVQVQAEGDHVPRLRVLDRVLGKL